MKGGFFTVYRGLAGYWITEDYALYKSTFEPYSRYDIAELKRARREHIDNSTVFEFGDCTYFVWFRCDTRREIAELIVRALHERELERVNFDD